MTSFEHDIKKVNRHLLNSYQMELIRYRFDRPTNKIDRLWSTWECAGKRIGPFSQFLAAFLPSVLLLLILQYLKMY